MQRPDRPEVTIMLLATRMRAFAGFVRQAPDLAELPHGLAGGHGDGERQVEAAAAAGHRDGDAGIRQIVNMIRDAADSRPNRRISLLA